MIARLKVKYNSAQYFALQNKASSSGGIKPTKIINTVKNQCLVGSIDRAPLQVEGCGFKSQVDHRPGLKLTGKIMLAVFSSDDHIFARSGDVKPLAWSPTPSRT